MQKPSSFATGAGALLEGVHLETIRMSGAIMLNAECRGGEGGGAQKGALFDFGRDQKSFSAESIWEGNLGKAYDEARNRLVFQVRPSNLKAGIYSL